MIVGSDITCPRCQNRDMTQRVSLIARQVEGTLTPAEIDGLMNQLSKGVAQEQTKPNGSATWEQLGKLFRFPPMPILPWWVNPSATTVRYGGLAIILTVVALLYFLSSLIPPPVLGLLACLILLFLFGLFGYQFSIGAGRARRAYESEMLAWSNARTNWTRTWYCARDNVIFVPPSLQAFAPDKISTLL